MKRLSITILVILGIVMPMHSITRAQLAQYAASLKGKKKADLKTAIFNISQAQYVLEYGSGEGKTWSGFYQTDRIGDNTVCDRYSNEIFEFTDDKSSVAGMNIEHSFPKSWWGGNQNNAYKDLYNLMPSESSINQSKSNYGMGVVTQIVRDNGCTKVGKGTTSGNTLVYLWEPADKWKGDFCRSYFYMATTYQDFTWTGEALNSLEQNTWPTFQQWAYTLYLNWVRSDSVSYTEVARNNAVANIQNNRNLFIDFPNLAEYIWGDSINVAFDPFSAITTASDEIRQKPTGTPIDDNSDPLDEVVYESDDIFALVSDVNNLSDGDSILIVSTTNKVALSTTQNTNNRGMTRVRIEGEHVTGTNNTAQRIAVELTNGYILFNTGDGYLYAASNSNNQLKTQTTANENAKASVSISNTGDATILFKDATHNSLRFNKASSLFSCYDPTITNQTTPVQIYKKQVRHGDVNADGKVDITDVTTLVDLILSKITSVPGKPDIDGNSFVNIQDVTTLVDLILGK